jgi:hypothetical protein
MPEPKTAVIQAYRHFSGQRRRLKTVRKWTLRPETEGAAALLSSLEEMALRQKKETRLAGNTQNQKGSITACGG